MLSDAVLQKKYASLLPHLNERSARLYLGSEAQSMGRGGKQKVAKLAGVSRVRIDKGIVELLSNKKVADVEAAQKIRKPGGGRKRHKESQSGLLEALEAIVNPHTR